MMLHGNGSTFHGSKNKHLVNILIVTAGSRGQRLLFRYPFGEGERFRLDNSNSASQSVNHPEWRFITPSQTSDCGIDVIDSHIKNGKLLGYPDNLIATILTPKPSLCNTTFELKIDDITIVGYPTIVMADDTDFCLLKEGGGKYVEDGVLLKLFNIVLVLKDVSPCLMQMYSSFCKTLAIALKHEERRCGYLSRQRKLMVDIQDEVASLPEGGSCNPYELILQKSSLAKTFQTVFDNLRDSGEVNIYLNDWLNISFCMPTTCYPTSTVRDAFQACWARSRPYHSLLFLQPEETILSSFPIDCSPSLIRLVRMCNPMKSFQTLSQDSDISLTQIFHFASHLVYWGRALLVYPLAEANVYVIAQEAPTEIDSKLAEDFVKLFPSISLHDCLAKFSFPTTLSEHRNPLSTKQQQREQIEIVTWLLKNRLLKQLHTYVYLMPPMESYASTEQSDWMFDDLLSAGAGNAMQETFDQLSVNEKAALLNMQNFVDVEDMQCFLKVCPYFRGEHHLEEIMYFENIMRSELLALIDKFRSLLVTVQHEDPATSCRF